MCPTAANRTVRPSGSTPVQLMPAPQITAMPPRAVSPARSSAKVSLTTELERPQPRASIASASRRCSTGRSALARQADTCSTYPPPVAESPDSAATLSTSRARPATAASAPISCGWNPSPRTEPSRWPSAATMATSVLLLPASMASTPDRASVARHAHGRYSRLWASRRSVRPSASSTWPTSGWASRARKTRSRPPWRAARRARSSYAVTAAIRPANSGSTGVDGQRHGAVAVDPGRHLDDRVVRQERQRAPVDGVDHVDGAGRVVADERGAQLDRRLGVVGAAPLAQQLGLLVQLRVGVQLEQLLLDRRHLGGTRRLRPLLADHLVVGVEVAQVVGRHDAELAEQARGQPELRGQLGGVVGQQLGQHVPPVDPDGALPREVVQPDVVEADRVRGDAEHPGEPPLEADGDVAQPDRPVPLLPATPW